VIDVVRTRVDPDGQTGATDANPYRRTRQAESIVERNRSYNESHPAAIDYHDVRYGSRVNRPARFHRDCNLLFGRFWTNLISTSAVSTGT
jgi:hypothetical protein